MSTAKQIHPAVSLTAFNCPHCGALAKQFWSTAFAKGLNKDNGPLLIDRNLGNFDLSKFKPEMHEQAMEWAVKLASAKPHRHHRTDSEHGVWQINNVFVSQCYNCEEVALWIYDTMLWPMRGNTPGANGDLPTDVRADYEEAATIVDLSPRGAAALLRLGVQKLCAALGGKGKNINEDIAMLVAKGLDVRVQQALDVVRVVGNNAVHPGQLDLKDDRETAAKLFALINLIAEVMITQPKHVAEMFNGLPEDAKRAIESRDKK